MEILVSAKDVFPTPPAFTERLLTAIHDLGSTMANPPLPNMSKTEGPIDAAPEASPHLTTSPAVTNLLLTTICAEVARSKDYASVGDDIDQRFIGSISFPEKTEITQWKGSLELRHECCIADLNSSLL